MRKNQAKKKMKKVLDKIVLQSNTEGKENTKGQKKSGDEIKAILIYSARASF